MYELSVRKLAVLLWRVAGIKMYIGIGRKKRVMTACLCCVLAVFSLFAALPAAFADDTEVKTVKVGYVSVKGYEEGGDGEYKSGFGYEYLQKISYYTGWKYEYVYGAYSELLEKLEDGEIDLLGDVSYLPSRAEQFNYSSYPQGNESYYIFTRRDRADLIGGSVSSIDGIRIGVTARSYQEEIAEKWFRKYEVSPIIVEFDGAAASADALENGDVDALIMTDAESQHGFIPIHCIGFSEYFFGVSKARTDILEELDNALYKIQSADPNYNNTLSGRYVNGTAATAFFSSDENEWLEAHNNTIRIGYLNDDLPYSAVDKNGALVGVLNVLVRNIEANYDIRVETTGYDTGDELTAALDNGEIDAAGPNYGDFYVTEKYEIVQTDPVYTTTPVIMYSGEELKAEKIAVNRRILFCSDIVKTFYPDAELVFCSDEEECLEAVSDGRADCMFLTSAKLNIVKQFRTTDGLNYVEMDQKANICMFMTREDFALSVILNKGIAVSEAELNGAEFIQSSYVETEYTFWDFIFDNYIAVIIVTVVVLVSFALVLWYLHRARISERKALEAEQKTSALNEALQKNKQTLEVALKAAEQANKSKTVFLNNMSHDIRTPMNGIIGMTAIAEAHIDDKDRVKLCLHKITNASSHLLSLINEVLDISRIESGKVLLSEEKFSLPDLFDNTVNMISSQVRAKHQKLSVHADNIINEDVVGDSLRLQQVFMNIVSNAVKYTPEGGSISIKLEEDPSESEIYSEYIFSCKDNGYGMTKEFLEKLFVPFERADDKKSRTEQGTGLGMAIANNIVRMMDGDIKVESEYGKGSTFYVSFRLKKQDHSDELGTLMSGVSVLVADNDKSACESICRILDDLGARSEYVLSGREAVDKITAAHESGSDYTVCMIAMKMPEMDGIETVRRIKAVGGDMAVIMISAYDCTDVETEARAAGVDAFLMKPIFKSRLSTVLKNLVMGDKVTEPVNVLDSYSAKDFSGSRILLVEDNELNREIAQEILGMTKASVETAENGRQALDMFEAHEAGYYDLILMDIQMPIMDGHQASRAIRALERPDARTVPIIAMSANAFAEDMESSKRAGMNGHISKPINFAKLLGVMESYLGKRTQNYEKYLETVKQKHNIAPAKYYEELYFSDGTTEISAENERACIDVLDKNGAVGIFGLLEEKDYPIYCVSGFALTLLGYKFEELMESTGGFFAELIHPDDRKRFAAEFYEKDTKHRYRMFTRAGKTVYVNTCSADTYRMDGKKVRMLSINVESSGRNKQ